MSSGVIIYLKKFSFEIKASGKKYNVFVYMEKTSIVDTDPVWIWKKKVHSRSVADSHGEKKIFL